MELIKQNGYSSGYGSGYSYGYGSGYSSGSDSGSGSGYGYGSGYSYGYGSGYSSGSDSGSGSGYGYGSGYSSGSGDGYGDMIIKIPQNKAWKAYHYINCQKNGQLVLRNGKIVKVGHCLQETKIKMCEYGLHASLRKEEAKQYNPSGILTEVLVWGQIIVGKDKLVATHRLIVKCLRKG